MFWICSDRLKGVFDGGLMHETCNKRTQRHSGILTRGSLKLWYFEKSRWWFCHQFWRLAGKVKTFTNSLFTFGNKGWYYYLLACRAPIFEGFLGGWGPNANPTSDPNAPGNSGVHFCKWFCQFMMTWLVCSGQVEKQRLDSTYNLIFCNPKIHSNHIWMIDFQPSPWKHLQLWYVESLHFKREKQLKQVFLSG